jgi:hypothetical protein
VVFLLGRAVMVGDTFDRIVRIQVNSPWLIGILWNLAARFRVKCLPAIFDQAA